MNKKFLITLSAFLITLSLAGCADTPEIRHAVSTNLTVNTSATSTTGTGGAIGK